MKCLVYFYPSECKAAFKVLPKVEYRDIEVDSRGIFRIIEYPKAMGKLALFVYLRRAMPLLEDAHVLEGSFFNAERELYREGGEYICATNLEGILNALPREYADESTGIIVLIHNATQIRMIESLVKQTQNITVFASEEIIEDADETMLELFGIAGGVRQTDTIHTSGKVVILMPGTTASKIKGTGFIINLSKYSIKTRCATPKNIYFKPPEKLHDVCKYTGNDSDTIQALMGFYGISETLIQVNSVKFDKQ